MAEAPHVPFRNIAIVGSGPTGIYTLNVLLAADEPMLITMFEASSLAGVGQPYSPESAQLSMLANIASIEIPALSQTYLNWLLDQPDAILALYGVDPATLHERQFLPRLLLGGWFRDELERLVATAPDRGHRVVLREATRVTDVEPVGEEVRVSFTSASGADSLLFSHVVLATGHEWPEDPDRDCGHFVTPWTGLIEAEVPAARVGILGTSLSAIDAMMAVACQHGHFADTAEGLAFRRRAGSEGLQITLMSRQGLLPEADFWCPLPYQPLRHFTETALAQEGEGGTEGLLDRLWLLFKRELTEADPDFARKTGLADLTVEAFVDVYFAPRLAADPFAWAAANLIQVERNSRERRTVEWRYAILRMHAPMEAMVALLDDNDRVRFEMLKRVFIDNYAAVPPQSIRRLLALRATGVLDILALGEDYHLARDDGQTQIGTTDGRSATFDVFIDARGQRGLGVSDLPFPALRSLLQSSANGRPEMPVDDAFAVSATGVAARQLFLPAAPYLLERLPFVQGIGASADLGRAVADAILGRDPSAPAD